MYNERKLSKKKLDEKVRLLKELKRKSSDIEIQIENLQDEIKEEMDKRRVTEIIGAEWRVSWKPYNSTKFDQKGFKEAFPSIYESYNVEFESRRFSIK